MKRLQSTRLRSAEPHRRNEKWIKTGEAYFDRSIREERVKHLTDCPGVRNVRRDMATERNPATKKLDIAWIVEWQELQVPDID